VHKRAALALRLLPVSLVIGLFFLLPLTVLMIVESYPFAMRSFALREASSNAGGLLVWPAKALILAGFFLLFTQTVSEIIKRLAILTGQIEEPEAKDNTC